MRFRDWDINIKVRLVGETVHNIFFWMFFPFMGLYFMEKFGAGMAGILMMVPPIAGVVANLYGGYAADRFGRKKMMVLSLAINSVLLLMFAFSPSPWLDYALYIGISMAGNIYGPASMAMITDLVSGPDRRMVFSAFYTFMNVGAVISPAVGAFLFFDHRQTLLLTSALVSFVLFLVMVKVVHETLPLQALASTKGLDVVGQLKSYAVVFTDRILLLYITAGIFVSLVLMQYDMYLGVYLREYVPDQSLGIAVLGLISVALYKWMFAVYRKQYARAMAKENVLVESQN